MHIREIIAIGCMGLLVALAGCANRTARAPVAAPLPPPLTANRQQLLERYQDQAEAVRSLSAAARLKAETGSAFSGVIKSYHEITALFVAEQPALIRVVGQAPVVGTDIFDMVSNGTTFHMYIPSRKRFLVGPAAGGPPAKSSIENLRPQPLFDALIWKKIPPDDPVVIEQEDQEQPPERDYVLTVLRNEGPELAVDRRIWFDRSDLRVTRIQIFGNGGQLESDIRYGDWREATPGAAAFPWHIELRRPQDDYQLEMNITRVTLNPTIPTSEFTLNQPPGTTRIVVGAGGQP